MVPQAVRYLYYQKFPSADLKNYPPEFVKVEFTKGLKVSSMKYSGTYCLLHRLICLFSHTIRSMYDPLTKAVNNTM